MKSLKNKFTNFDLDLDTVNKLPESKPSLPNRRRMRRMSTFKDVIQDTIKKNRIIKQISFSIEAARERNNPPRRLKSPPPPCPEDKVSSEEEEIENEIVDIEKRIENENTMQKAELATVNPTRLLKHSASFYFSKDCNVSKSIPTCPPTPMKNSCVVGMKIIIYLLFLWVLSGNITFYSNDTDEEDEDDEVGPVPDLLVATRHRKLRRTDTSVCMVVTPDHCLTPSKRQIIEEGI